MERPAGKFVHIIVTEKEKTDIDADQDIMTLFNIVCLVKRRSVT